jgi:hypothetical protein
MSICCIFWSFGVFCHVLVNCTKENLTTLKCSPSIAAYVQTICTHFDNCLFVSFSGQGPTQNKASTFCKRHFWQTMFWQATLWQINSELRLLTNMGLKTHTKLSHDNLYAKISDARLCICAKELSLQNNFQTFHCTSSHLALSKMQPSQYSTLTTLHFKIAGSNPAGNF